MNFSLTGKSLSIGDYSDTSAKFMVIEGRNNIYARIQQMITETKNQISTMTTVPSLIRADQFGLFDVGFKHPLKSRVKFRFLTEMSEQNVPAMKTLLKEIADARLNFEGRNPDLGLRLFPRMVIRDEDEILFFIRSAVDASATEQDNACIWTNCKDLIHAFTGIFEQLWRNSTDVQTRIEEFETGISTHAANATLNYFETLRSAENEIVMMTSSEGLVSSWKNLKLLRELAKGNVSIRIMAPITNENLQAVQQLSEFCEVRHIPRSAIGTTIIDGKHLFQFTNPTHQENPEITPHSENSYYTDNQEYMERIKGMLNDIWKTASIPSAITLESILTPSKVTLAASDSDRARLSAKSGFKGTVIMGIAVVHPPSHLNLLDMMIRVQKSTKESDFGASDTIIFSLCLGPPKSDLSHKGSGGFSAYVPLAIVNNNPRSTMMLKALYKGSPAAQNVILAKPQQLEAWKQGNTLFAGWTMPIPLLPPKYSLPPSCILFEGIGEAKHKTGTHIWPSGYKVIAEYDNFEAFATFINPSSNYSGPGTDGCLRTNMITVTTPP